MNIRGQRCGPVGGYAGHLRSQYTSYICALKCRKSRSLATCRWFLTQSQKLSCKKLFSEELDRAEQHSYYAWVEKPDFAHVGSEPLHSVNRSTLLTS